MGRCLIVANQTLGGAALDRAVRDCIHRGLDEFYVVVPRTKVRDEVAAWAGGFGVYEGMAPDHIITITEEAARDHEAALAEARRRAQQRLERMLEKIAADGGHVEGEVGIDDPLQATEEVLERRGGFDEIIVSTLPPGLSRWVRMDVPHRIARLTDVPVTTVEAEAEPA